MSGGMSNDWTHNENVGPQKADFMNVYERALFFVHLV